MGVSRAPYSERIAAVALALCAAGCGGGGSSGGGGVQVTPPPPPPQANGRPVVINSNPAALPVSLHPFELDVAKVFSDPDNDPLSYAISLSGPPSGLVVVGSRVTGVLPAAGFVDFSVIASDGRGGAVSWSYSEVIRPNSLPTVVRPNNVLLTMVGAHINYDATQAGGTFADPEGDALTYEMSIVSPSSPGLTVEGTRVVGSLNAVGAASFTVWARDAYGGAALDRFAVAVAAPPPGAPTLPEPTYVYDDAQLPLPETFRSSRENFGPLWDQTPNWNPTTNAGATLGRVLFYDKRLSVTNTHSCGSCHLQERAFADQQRFSTGIVGTAMRRTTMGLSNVRHNFDNRYFSDRRTSGLETVVLMPIKDAAELGQPLAALEQKLAATDFYPPLFEAAFGTPEINRDRISKALAQFLRSILSFRSRFDAAYGDEIVPSLLTPEEASGLELFNGDARCSRCHRRHVQLLDDPENNGLDAVITDVGSGNGIFRAASLRNIGLTAPYMHDGRFATLREVIEHYNSGIQDNPHLSLSLRTGPDGGPIRLNLSEQDKAALEAFLNALTDNHMVTDPRFADPFQ